MSEIQNEKQSLPEEFNKKQDLKKYLEKEINQHRNAARLKSILAHLLFWIVILASGLGLLNIAIHRVSNELMSGIAIIPGIVLIVSNTFKYEARAKWHKLKQRKLEGLCRKLMFEDATANDISKEITIVLEELDKIRVELEKPVTSR
jgi:hypothetical protein